VTSRPAIVAVRGDITVERVDAIVNAANASLIAGGGVDGAIHRAAGGRELSAALRELGGCAIGDAKYTPGFRLPARFIIHTVGPIWQGGHHQEAELLASCYRRCLEVADHIGASSVAFPALSTGAFGFPDEPAAEIAVRTLRATASSVRLIHLVAFDSRTYDLYERELNRGAGE
jgi:O-acetyl-ADP-ribose deacetylase